MRCWDMLLDQDCADATVALCGCRVVRWLVLYPVKDLQQKQQPRGRMPTQEPSDATATATLADNALYSHPTAVHSLPATQQPVAMPAA